MAHCRLAAAAAVLTLLAACGKHGSAPSAKPSVTARAAPGVMYVPEGMKDRQDAIRLGDRLRRKLGGKSVRFGRFAQISPVMALRNPYRNPVETSRLKAGLSPTADATPGMVEMRFGGRQSAKVTETR